MVCLRYDGTHDHSREMFAGLFTGGIFVSFLTYIVNNDSRKEIAEAIVNDWKEVLGIDSITVEKWRTSLLPEDPAIMIWHITDGSWTIKISPTCMEPLSIPRAPIPSITAMSTMPHTMKPSAQIQRKHSGGIQEMRCDPCKRSSGVCDPSFYEYLSL